jgi:hypothetical protein
MHCVSSKGIISTFITPPSYFVVSLSMNIPDVLFPMNIRHNIHKLIYCFILLWIVYGCQDTPDQAVGQQLIVEDLLRQVDSLPQEMLTERLNQLTTEQRSDFFSQRLAALESSGQVEDLPTTLSLYEQYTHDPVKTEQILPYYNGIYLQYKGMHDSADVLYLRAVEACQRNKDSMTLAKYLDTRAGNLSMMGRFDDAIAAKYQALDICESIHDEPLAMYIRAFLSNLYVKKREYEKAIQLGEIPLQYFRTQANQSMEAYILLLQANAYLDLNKPDSSIALHKRIQQIYYALGQPPNMNEHLYHYSRVLIKKGLWQEALDSLDVAKRRILSSQDKQGLVFVDLAAADALFQLGRLDEASRIMEDCLAQAIARKLYSAAAATTRILSSIKKTQGNYQQALQLLDQHLGLKDTLFNEEKNRITRELSVKYETAQKEQQITSLQREITLAKQRNAWIAGTLISLMLGFLYILRIRFLRKQQQLKADKLLAEAKSETLRQQVVFQEAELATHQAQLQDYTQMLISKNKQLAELSKQQQPTTETALPQQELEELYNSVIHTDKDWELFQIYFNKVHPGFIAHIKQLLPDLSPAELRTLLLDKMNLSLKEQAEILGVSIDAVKKGRYRLRKNYKLAPEENISALWENVQHSNDNI